jgi:hypothetical protein
MKQLNKNIKNNGFRVIWWLMFESIAVFLGLTFYIKYGALGLFLFLVALAFSFRVASQNHWRVPATAIMVYRNLTTATIILGQITVLITTSLYKILKAKLVINKSSHTAHKRTSHA